MDNREIIMTAMRNQGAADAQRLRERAVAGTADGTEVIANEACVPTWTMKDYSAMPVGSPYQYEGQLYKLWQQHDATGQVDWSPDKAVSLWDIYHTKDPDKAKPYVAPQGTRGMYQTGEVCSTEAGVWQCNVDNCITSPDAKASDWTLIVPAETEDADETVTTEPDGGTEE